MEVRKSLNVWTWLVGLLAVCNIALIATIWLRPPYTPPPPPRHINFNKQLGLSKEQNEKIELLHQSQMNKIDSIKKVAKVIREQFFLQLKTDKPNTTLIDSLSSLLGHYHQLVELQTFAHFKNIRSLLDSAQRPLFDSLVQEIVKSLPEQPRFKDDGNEQHRGRGERDGQPGFGPPPPPPGPPEGEPQAEDRRPPPAAK